MNFTVRGFTFIELLITISIMVLMFTLGIGSYREFVRRQQVIAVTRQIKSDLKTAQQESVVGKKPDHVNCNNSTLVGYKIRYSVSGGYDVVATCEAGEVVVKTKIFGLDTDIELLPFSEFMFLALAKGVDDPSVMRVQQASTGIYAEITISINGEVR